MAVTFKESTTTDVDEDLFGFPPTDWRDVIERFIDLDKRLAPIELTGRDAKRSLDSVYTSINTALRKARKAGKPYPVRVSKRGHVIRLYRTDMLEA